ncbi:MAG: hypothetical protein HN509_16255 [Halobacteriovoraceae bacterium]|jgi:histone H3/H4|nr:hypothetical protein [Halobacteriovoraceae bacterium]MBT5093233.1 hypothetical protein [Halobacteriovoraceae bacterium]
MSQSFWRKCATCKKEIGHLKIYQKCSVSSCRKNVYCSVTCWDVHVPVMNHKSAWAEEMTAPGPEAASDERPKRRIIVGSKPKESIIPKGDFPIDVLIVASKLKNYVKEKHGMNTSGNVMEALSEVVRRATDDAVEKATIDGRKTLMDRDF